MENSKMLIDPEPLKQQVQDCINRCYRFGIDSVGPLAMFLDYIKDAPRIEAKEVIHATWMSYLDGDDIMPDIYYKCSNCGSRGHRQKWHYCPSCSATMD